MPIYLSMEQFEQFCKNAWRPQVLQGFLLTWLTQHFSIPENIEEPSLQNYVWTNDYKTTKIVIDSVTRFDPTLIEGRPAIMVKPGAQRNNQIGIGDRMQFSPSDGNNYFATYWMGSHVIFCIAGSGTEALLLATEVAREIAEFGWTLRQALNLFKLRVAQIGECYKLEEAKENFVVPVVMTYAYEQAWQVKPDAPMLNSISLSMFTP